MFADITIGDWLSDIIRFAVGAFIDDSFGELTLAIKTVIRSSLVFCLLAYGVRFMTGDSNGTFKQLTITCVWVILALGITSSGFYKSFIYTPIFEVKDNLTAFIMGAPDGKSMYQDFSETNSRLFDHASNVLKASNSGLTTDFGLLGIALSIYVIYGVYYCMFIGITLFCELSLGIIILFGSIIIPISGFKSARGMGKSWVIAIVKYASVFFVIAFIVSLLNVISNLMIDGLMEEVYIKGQLDDGNVGINSPTFGGVLLIGVFGIYLLLQVMEFTTEVTGGVMSDAGKGVTSVTNAAKNGVNALSSGSRMGGSALSALKAAKAARAAT